MNCSSALVAADSFSLLAVSRKTPQDRACVYPTRVSARKRFIIAAVCGLAGGFLASRITHWQTSVLLGWDTAAMVFLVWVWADVRGKDSKATGEMATREDNSRAIADLMLNGASLASLVGVFFALVKAADLQGGDKAALTVIAIVSVLTSWMVVHVVFMLHYAHLYYSKPQGGIDFHDDHDPQYTDFAYLAFTIGTTYQVSDTELNSGIVRRSVLRHALLSYVFGTAIVATMINVVAGALS
ncbi:MAG: DUF1345 domain-containing protein [Actinomycetota bacterium]